MKKVSNTQGRSARNRLILRWALFACAIGSTPYYCQSTHAQTWNTPTDGSWHDGANWSGGTIPDSIDADVIINALNPPVTPPDEPLSPYEVYLDAATTVKSLLLDSPDAVLHQVGSTLTVVDSINLSQGSYILDQSTISGGTLQTNGNLILGGENIFNGVRVLDQLAPSAEIYDSQLTLQNGTVLEKGITFGPGTLRLILDQDLHLLSGNQITTQELGYMNINQDRTLTIDTGASINANDLIVYGQGTLVNNGIISNFTQGVSISLSISNDGVVNNGTIEAGNHARINIDSGSFHNTIEGEVIASDGGRITIGRFFGESTWTNDGLIRVADADSTIVLGGKFTGAQLATIENIHGGHIEIGGKWDNSNQYTFGSQQGQIVLSQFGSVVGGELSAGPNGEFLQLKGGTLDGVQFNENLTLGNSDGVALANNTVIAGDINVNGGSLRLYQDFTTAPGQQFNFTGSPGLPSSLLIGSDYSLTITESNVLNVSNANLFSATFNSGTLINEGTVSMQDTNGGALAMENKGHLVLVDSNTSFQNSSGSINNQSTGTIDIADGARLDTGYLTNSGQITLMGSSSVLNIGSVASPSLSGIDNEAGGTVAVKGYWDNQQGYTFNSTLGSIHLYGSITGGTLTPGTNGEFLIVHGGSLNNVTLNGNLNLSPGSNFELSGNTQVNGNIKVGGNLFISQDLAIHENQTLTLSFGALSHIIVSSPYELTFDSGSVLNGSGSITTSNGTIQIDGTVSPGFSPGHIEFQSDVILGATSKLEIELASLNSFDTLAIKGDAVLGGDLHVSLLNGFALQSNQSFLFMNIDGTSSGLFNGLAENGVVGNYNGTDLFISYLGGDGNDVRLFTIAAVPEPASFGLLAACGAIYVGWRRKSKKTRASNTESCVA